MFFNESVFFFNLDESVPNRPWEWANSIEVNGAKKNLTEFCSVKAKIFPRPPPSRPPWWFVCMKNLLETPDRRCT